MSNQQQQQQNPIPVQPETIIIECSARNSIRSSDNNDEWEVSIPPVELKQGDEIGVNQSFLEARGTSTEILEFSSSGLDKNNSQRIYFEYYCSDDGTNDKNKGRDWMYFGAGGEVQPPYDASPSLHETAKTYRPCKALRYDNLLTESLITANGNELKRNIGGSNYQTIKPNDVDPRVANAFSINYKEDINVSGIFNSVNTINEMNTHFNKRYVGECNTQSLNAQEKTLTLTDSIINLDGLDYWELIDHPWAGDSRVELRTPYFEDGTNYISNIPHGTVVWIDWMPKRRQMSVYSGANMEDFPYTDYEEYPEISDRVGGLCGHFMVSLNNSDTSLRDKDQTFIDNGTLPPIDAHTPPTVIQYGYAGKKCISTYFYRLNPDQTFNSFFPRVDLCNPLFTLTEVDQPYAEAKRTYANPYTTQSKKNFINTDGNTALLRIQDPCPVNLVIRKSPYYIGSCKLNLNQAIPDRLAQCPTCRPNGGTQHPTRFSDTEDATLTELFPKIIENPNDNVAVYLGNYHPQNLETEASVYDFTTQTAKKPFNSLGQQDKPALYIKHYNSINNNDRYAPLGYNGTYFLKEDLDSNETSLIMNIIPESSLFERLKTCAGNIIVLERGTGREEWLRMGKILAITDETGTVGPNPTRIAIEILARNFNENLILFTGGNTPTQFDQANPVSWVNPPAGAQWTYMSHPANSKIEWWDWRECKTLSVELTNSFGLDHPRGLPILKNCGYWGTGEHNTGGLPSFVNDESLYTSDLKQIYNFGYSYYLYYKRTSLLTPGVSPNDLPDNDWVDITTEAGIQTFFLGGKMSQNKGIWMFPLVESIHGDSDKTFTNFGVPEHPPLTAQVRNSSDSPNASLSKYGWWGQFNPHTPIFNMNFDFEINRSMIDPDSHGLLERNFYIWIPDFFEFMSNHSTLQRWSNQGINYYCGYVPLINQITLETSKDYLTPTDLSNFWTESLHKSSDITNLLDGTTIKNSRNRGILQNPLLIPIYGSWGNYNLPDKSGYLTRDYFTFGMVGGYALGSVIFIDGHPMASDWTWKKDAYTDAIKNRDGYTYYIYPRNQNNLVHLWQADTGYPLPTYTVNRNRNFDGGPAQPGGSDYVNGTANKKPTTDFNWWILDPATGNSTGVSYYPSSTSGKQNNPNLSNLMPTVNVAYPGDTTVSQGNFSYSVVAPTPPRPATDQKAVPAYSKIALDKFDLWTADADYPFNGQNGPREDPIYRTTEPYPLQYYSDTLYGNYLKFSQYLGCDNMTLTYNPNFSAFEFQFLHQPFATTFNLNGGQGSGGDNAVRIFSNIPEEVINWEKYSGINVRNWATPMINSNEFTYAEIQNRPAILAVEYPNGINPETDLDLVGDRFMNKLGFTTSQYNPRTGTNVKGNEGMGKNSVYPLLYIYEPAGTTGADTDVADAIINTSFSAEDNPNSEARDGLGQLIFYPSSEDPSSNQIRHSTTGSTNVPSGVRMDFSYSLYGQRGGLKTNNHNKSMGFPNIVGTPQVEDILTFPITLNPDGEQRTGYTIEIGSTAVRATNLPIKLTDGYYYILCPDLIDDPQFYISNNNGSVIPAIAIVSKTYVSGDFYTTFQSPIRFYCKKAKTITSIKIQIRNSSMGIPSNLGANSSVIFAINRYTPRITNPPLDTASQQAVDYSILKTNDNLKAKLPTTMSTLNDINMLVNGVFNENANQADYLGALQQRINNYDIPSMRPTERQQFFNTPQGMSLQREMNHVTALGNVINQQEEDPGEDLVAEQQEKSDRLLEAIRQSARVSFEQKLETLNNSPMEEKESRIPDDKRVKGVNNPLSKINRRKEALKRQLVGRGGSTQERYEMEAEDDESRAEKAKAIADGDRERAEDKSKREEQQERRRMKEEAEADREREKRRQEEVRPPP